MDDLDRTFLKLKKLNYNDLALKLEAAGISPSVDFYTFDFLYPDSAEEICNQSGWTLDELNDRVRNLMKEVTKLIV